MDFSPLVSASFWFSLTPHRMVPLFEGLLFGFMALLVVLGAVVRIFARNEEKNKYKKTALLRIGSAGIVTGLCGLLWWFFSYEEIQIFGMRAWFLVLMLGFAIALFRAWRFVKKEVPLLMHKEQSRADANKYLPRRA